MQPRTRLKAKIKSKRWSRGDPSMKTKDNINTIRTSTNPKNSITKKNQQSNDKAAMNPLCSVSYALKESGKKIRFGHVDNVVFLCTFAASNNGFINPILKLKRKNCLFTIGHASNVKLNIMSLSLITIASVANSKTQSLIETQNRIPVANFVKEKGV